MRVLKHLFDNNLAWAEQMRAADPQRRQRRQIATARAPT